MIPRIKDLLTKKLNSEFDNFSLPKESVNISSPTADKTIVNADSVVLFSASKEPIRVESDLSIPDLQPVFICLKS